MRRNPVKEIGWYDLWPTDAGRSDPLFCCLDDQQKMFQWHGDTFDLPKRSVRLASSPDCLNQAFRYGENVYGLQFHLEVDPPIIDRWLNQAGNRREIAAGWNSAEKIAEIRHDTGRYMEASAATGQALFSAATGRLRRRRRRTALPSR